MPSEDAIAARFRFSLPRSALEELAAVSKNGPILEQIIELVRQGGPIVDPESTIKSLSTHTGISVLDAAMVFRGLVNLTYSSRSLGVGTEPFIDSLTNYLAGLGGKFGKDAIDAWLSSREIISRILASIGADHPLVLFGKSRDVLSSHEKVMAEATIITGLRPVFNQSGTEIFQFTVVHDLVLQYHTGESKGAVIQIALDAIDIDALCKQCQRAEIKANALKTKMNAAGIPTTIWHEFEVSRDGQ